MSGVGKQFVYDLACEKLGADTDEWLVTPHPSLAEHDRTPHGLIESGCPACLDQVTRLLEAM
ncbi:hypothetical protein PJN91_17215 [Mycobacterium kansasii]